MGLLLAIRRRRAPCRPAHGDGTDLLHQQSLKELIVARLSAIASSTVVFLFACAAYADRGAVSAEIGSGVALMTVRAPYAIGAPTQIGTAWTTSGGVRYALTNSLELGASAFYQPATTFTH